MSLCLIGCHFSENRAMEAVFRFIDSSAERLNLDYEMTFGEIKHKLADLKGTKPEFLRIYSRSGLLEDSLAVEGVYNRDEFIVFNDDPNRLSPKPYEICSWEQKKPKYTSTIRQLPSRDDLHTTVKGDFPFRDETLVEDQEEQSDDISDHEQNQERGSNIDPVYGGIRNQGENQVHISHYEQEGQENNLGDPPGFKNLTEKQKQEVRDFAKRYDRNLNEAFFLYEAAGKDIKVAESLAA